MDLAQLNMEILSTLDTDLTVKSYLTDTDNLKYKNWSRDDQGYVHINKHIFVPSPVHSDSVSYSIIMTIQYQVISV